MCRNFSLGLILASILLPSSLAGAAYFIAQRDPAASDAGPGTAERPWKTVSKAATGVGPGDTVIISDGIYRESVVLKPAGTAQAPIRFEAAPGAHVVLTGADQLKGWRKSEEHRPIYEIPWSYRFITWSKNMTHPD